MRAVPLLSVGNTMMMLPFRLPFFVFFPLRLLSRCFTLQTTLVPTFVNVMFHLHNPLLARPDPVEQAYRKELPVKVRSP